MFRPQRKYTENPNSYYSETVSRIREKYKINIFLVRSIEDIEKYLNDNPKEDKIGFIFNCRIPEKSWDIHYTPIYFERKKTGAETEAEKVFEYFIQIDSMGYPFLLPTSSDSNITRIHYFSPFQRQFNDLGCFEDGITILRKCFEHSDIFSFCQSNSSDLRLNKLTEGAKTIYDKSASIVREIFPQQKPIDLKEITTLPARFLTNIEHYGTMRHFKTTEPEKFKEIYKKEITVGEHIKNKGETRVDSDDFKGQDFTNRRTRYILKILFPVLYPVLSAVEQLALYVFTDCIYPNPVADNSTVKILSKYHSLFNHRDLNGQSFFQMALRLKTLSEDDLNNLIFKNYMLDKNQIGFALTSRHITANNIIPFVTHLMYVNKKCKITLCFILIEIIKNNPMAREFLKVYSTQIINELKNGLKKEELHQFLFKFYQTQSTWLNQEESINLFLNQSDMALLQEFNLNPIEIAENTSIAPEEKKRLLPKLNKAEEVRATDSFFTNIETQKKGSYWNNTKADKSIENIIKHALGMNNTLFFGGYSGKNTRKILGNYGVIFNSDFKKLTREEQINIVVGKINQTERRKIIEQESCKTVENTLIQSI